MHAAKEINPKIKANLKGNPENGTKEISKN